MRRSLGPPGDRLYLQPNCARCGLARFTTTDRAISPLCAGCQARLALRRARARKKVARTRL